MFWRYCCRNDFPVTKVALFSVTCFFWRALHRRSSTMQKFSFWGNFFIFRNFNAFRRLNNKAWHTVAESYTISQLHADSIAKIVTLKGICCCCCLFRNYECKIYVSAFFKKKRKRAIQIEPEYEKLFSISL